MNQALPLRREERAGQDAAAVRCSTAACRKPKLYLASSRRDDGTVVAFDHVGRTVSQYYPVTEPKGANTSFNPAFDAIVPTTMVYDLRDRVTRTTLPDLGVTTLDYAFGPDRSGTLQFETLVKDANVNANKPGAIKSTYRDVGQQIVAVKEKLGATDLWTSYAYDPLKQIVEVKDDQGNLTQAVYDNLGRRVSLNNPDTGLTAFTFDLAGNLTAKVTANLKAVSQAIAYDYDFTRPKSVTYPVNTGNNIAYAYGPPGAPNNTAGRLIKTVSQMGSEERTYGKLGETTYEKKTVVTFTNPSSPSVFETRYAFDTFGRLQTLIYPDGEVLTNTYDSGGNLQSAEGAKRVDSTGQNHRYRYLNALHYDKFEQRVLMEQTNGVKTAYAYDPKTRRLNSLTAGKGQGAALFQNLSYGYDPVGNILSLKNLTDSPQANDYGGPVFQQYQYDELYRLTRAQGVFQYNKTGTTPDAAACNGSGVSHCRVYALDLTYDSIHNIKAKHQLDTRYPPGAPGIVQKKTSYNWAYAYNPSGATSTRPHAPTHIGDLTYTHDANGNQTGWTHDLNGTRRTIVWNEDNRIHTLDDNGHTKAYKYDDQGTRVIKRGPQGETVYVNQFYTQRPGATGSKHVYAGTGRIASKLLRQDVPGANPNGKTPYEKDIYFYHPDHLGSSSYVTDLNGKLYEHLQYFPFGEGWIEENSNAQRTPYLFTAKELDEETGLYYFGARYYDPRTSVWQSGDPILGKYLPIGRQDEEKLPGMGGIYNPPNLALYSYGHLNPVRYHDPDGNAVWKIPFTDTYLYVGKGAIVATTTAQDLSKNHPKLSELTPRAKETAQRVLVEMEGRGHNVRVVEAKRTTEQQAVKVATGKSKTMDSKHLTGEAVDIVSKKYGYDDRPGVNKASKYISPEAAKAAQEYFKEYGEVVKGEGMTWGGEFYGEKLKYKPDPVTGYGWDPGHAEMKPAKPAPQDQ
jgi:RHS repeat-associated protein